MREHRLTERLLANSRRCWHITKSNCPKCKCKYAHFPDTLREPPSYEQVHGVLQGIRNGLTDDEAICHIFGPVHFF